MAEAIEFITLGVCGLGAVVVTGMALFNSPTKTSASKPRQLAFDLDNVEDGAEAKKPERDDATLASRS
jgi:hypothetical protein